MTLIHGPMTANELLFLLLRQIWALYDPQLAGFSLRKFLWWWGVELYPLPPEWISEGAGDFWRLSFLMGVNGKNFGRWGGCVPPVTPHWGIPWLASINPANANFE